MFIQFLKEDNPRCSTIELRGKDSGRQTFFKVSNINDIINIRMEYSNSPNPINLVINKQFFLSKMSYIQQQYRKN